MTQFEQESSQLFPQHRADALHVKLQSRVTIVRLNHPYFVCSVLSTPTSRVETGTDIGLADYLNIAGIVAQS